MMNEIRTHTADNRRIAKLPESVYEKFGGIKQGTRELLVLAWMRTGVALDDKEVQTPSGVVHVPRGSVWGSMDSMRDDIFAGVGKAYSRRQIQYTVKKLESSFIEGSQFALPHTRGAYGKIYQLPKVMIDSDEFRVNVAKKYMLFAYGDPSEFMFGERVMGNLKGGRAKRGRYSNANKFMNWVAKNGTKQAAYTTIGRWKVGDEGNFSSPVFVPWITIDIDGPDLLEASKTAERVVYELHERGFDLERTFVSFSGAKGFHVQVSTDQIACPIFEDNEAARAALKTFIESVTEGERCIDPVTASPNTLIRLTGSRHEDSGLYKRTWIGRRYIDLSEQEIFADLDSHKPFHFDDPTQGEVEEEALRSFMDSAKEAEKKMRELQKNGKRKKQGSVMSKVMRGVGEGEIFGDKYFHVGRENAAYIAACWLLEKESTPSEAMRRLEQWNELNEPPLPHNRLMTQYRGAKRTVL